ncbi:Recombinase [Caballeronia fortuita]|uniref:Recombinase n=1 Tax=Caballeronia fortuita TaxID=1777138 RepID=A0A158B2V4_9BURK|nr:recombinase family protein [Caballeronia fortuita]SAK63627.1 Recombinase [Caballeronia fortuita]
MPSRFWANRAWQAGSRSNWPSVKTERGSDYQVNKEEAAIVRFIFEKFAAGWSTLQICDDLNGRGVPSPRGGTWRRSALYGSPNKGSGILNNSAYIGVYIWNRSQWLKDPDSGKRVREDRPELEWKTDHRDHYRIVQDDLWHAVRARMGADRLNSGAKGKSAPPRTLFSGVLCCALCGGALTAINPRYYGCVTRKERGKHACEGISVYREQTDERLLSVLRDELCSEPAQADIDAGRSPISRARRYPPGRGQGRQSKN